MRIQIKVLAIAALIAVGATSCKKDNDDPKPSTPTPQPTKTELMAQNKGWKLIGMTANGTDMFPIFPACEKDNVMTFKTNGTYVSDAGATKCDPADPQIENGSWKFIAGETKMVMDNEDTSTVVKLTADTLRIQAISVEDAQQSTIIATFVKAK